MDVLHYIPHSVVAAITGVIAWLGKRVWNDMSEKVSDAVADIKATKEAVAVQNTNHLEHIQETGRKTVELLEAMRVEQAETNGYLKAIVKNNAPS